MSAEKKIYTQPQLEVVRFASEDIIVTSAVIVNFDPVNDRNRYSQERDDERPR